MSVTESAGPTFTYSDATGIAELRTETLRTLVGITYALATLVIAIGVVDLSQRDPERWFIIASLAAGAYASQKLIAWDLRLSSVLLISGYSLALVIATLLYPLAQLASLSAIITMIGFVLLGGRSGLVLATLCSGLVVGERLLNLDPTNPGPIGAPLALIWFSLLICWLAARPTLTALDWSWTSFVRARDITEQLRDRQAELARVSKSLNEAYIRLEQINADLERSRRAADEARRLKAEFAAWISHELRTPLNLIIGFSEMIVAPRQPKVDQRVPAGLRADVEAIYRNALHISTLIDDVLDLSRIEAHRMALQRERSSLGDTIREAVGTVSNLVSEAGLTLSLRIPPDLPALFIDRTRVKQILINLINNSVRSTDEGELVIGAERRENDVVVSVADPGVGISPDVLPHLFEEFTQFGGSNRRGRSGLGLAVSRQFAELHGGTLSVESEQGTGSTFYLSLPIQPDVVTSPYESLPDVLGRISSDEPPRLVAVIGDDADSAKLFIRYLDGFQVVAATSSQAAELLASENPPRAVVLADERAVAEWKSVDTRLPIPAVFCALSTTSQRAEELGVAGYLVKPVSRDQISAALERASESIGRSARDILIVEDDAEMARLLIRMVRSISRRYRPVWKSNGQDGLEHARGSRPDAILLDLLMPTLDGYEFLVQLRETAGLSDVPVVIVSARERQEEPVLANLLTLSRPGGLTVADVMRCTKSALECLISPLPAGNDPARQPALRA